MIVAFAFWLFLLGALSIGWQIGDASDRRAMGAIFCAALATSLMGLLFDGMPKHLAVRVVDLLLLAIMVRIAMTSDRHWPMWFAGIHATATLIGFSALILPDARAPVLYLAAASWAIPGMTAMVVGLLLDRKNGVGDYDQQDVVPLLNTSADPAGRERLVQPGRISIP